MIRIFKKFSERKNPSYTVSASCISDRGMVRENNEDNMYFDGKCMMQNHDSLSHVISIQRTSNHTLFFAVFDGMGGEACGELASYLAASEFKRAITQKEMGEKSEVFLKIICQQMNDLICKEAERQGAKGMGTTASILLFRKNQVYVCNLGDSPIFRLRQGKMEAIYEEHTDRLFLEEQGISKRKAALTQCLGIPKEEMIIQPYIKIQEVERGDQYLICSDGLTDMLTLDEIKGILSEELSIETSVEKLLVKVKEHGACDNTTIILCRIA